MHAVFFSVLYHTPQLTGSPSSGGLYTSSYRSLFASPHQTRLVVFAVFYAVVCGWLYLILANILTFVSMHRKVYYMLMVHLRFSRTLPGISFSNPLSTRGWHCINVVRWTLLGPAGPEATKTPDRTRVCHRSHPLDNSRKDPSGRVWCRTRLSC